MFLRSKFEPLAIGSALEILVRDITCMVMDGGLDARAWQAHLNHGLCLFCKSRQSHTSKIVQSPVVQYH